MVTISVKPLLHGWLVECGRGVVDQVFATGGCAERSAVRLAAAFAKVGRSVKVVVHDRHGKIAGSLEVLAGAGHGSPWRATVH